jgi:hypothetical protein
MVVQTLAFVIVRRVLGLRWMRTVRSECLDWTLLWNRRYLWRVLTSYLAHHSSGRPHRVDVTHSGIGLDVPVPATVTTAITLPIAHRVERDDVVGSSGGQPVRIQRHSTVPVAC